MNKHANIATSANRNIPGSAHLETDSEHRYKLNNEAAAFMAIQSRPAVGEAYSPLEHEAGAIADTIMHVPE